MSEKAFKWIMGIMGVIAVVLVLFMAITGNQMTDDLADIVKELEEIERMSLQIEAGATKIQEYAEELHPE